MSKSSEQLYNVNEIFYSIQGEGTRAGRPCTFIRLQGCLLRCSWCDTPYALDRKKIEKHLSLENIESEIEKYSSKHIMLTGGEPLEQKNISELIRYFCNKNYELVIETSGQENIAEIDKRAFVILDIKCPSSLMHKKNAYENINYIRQCDEVKFVVAGASDFDFAVDVCRKYEIYNKTKNILFSPLHKKLELRWLAEKVKSLEFPARLQVQLHKYIWGEDERGV